MTALRDQVPLVKASPNGQQPGARGDPARRASSARRLGALRFAGRLAMVPPQAMAQLAPGASLEMLRIALGKSHVEPGKGDHRFTDQAWQQNPAFRGAMQAYLFFGSSVDDVTDSLGLDGRAAERVRFALMLVREAMAPTNYFWTNPAAVKRCYDTGGLSVWRGARQPGPRHVRNHGMPSMVDRKPFKLGETIAISPGAVIHRSEVFELIQYTPQRDTVYARPLLVVPPQVNKYYALDLSPGRSMYEYLLKQRHRGVHHQLAQPDRGAA